MPRFTEHEKTLIQEKLLAEGELLFSAHGLKKITIDELATAASISKASFYAFYPSKEMLFMDISARLQQKMWGEVKVFLEENRHLPPKALLKQCVLLMLKAAAQYPMLLMIDKTTIEQLYRKLPPEVLAAHTHEDEEPLLLLEEYGVCFTCSTNIAASTLQTLALSLMQLQHENTPNAPQVQEILINGIVGELVEEE